MKTMSRDYCWGCGAEIPQGSMMCRHCQKGITTNKTDIVMGAFYLFLQKNDIEVPKEPFGALYFEIDNILNDRY
jgi:hypothetical protein